MRSSAHLNQAKYERTEESDEFYTHLADIKKEVGYCRDLFKGKVVYCNCDDYRFSKFHEYFTDNFAELGLKKLITTCYKRQDLFDHEDAVCVEFDGVSRRQKTLKGDGDFRGGECLEFLKEADIIATNPPFSLFISFIETLKEYNKKFLIIGHMLAMHYEGVFPLIKQEEIWIGSKINRFIRPNGSIHGVNCLWYSNLRKPPDPPKTTLTKRYKPEEYPKYGNYEAIEVDTYKNIPMDYKGVMGVPLPFLAALNRKQFKLIGVSHIWDRNPDKGAEHLAHGDSPYLNGEKLFVRVFIKNNDPK